MERCSSCVRVCMTCQNWGGDRELAPNRAEVYADAQEQGRCYIDSIPTAENSAKHDCRNWQKWEALQY